MKKLLSIFICVLLLIMPLCVTAFAANEVVISAPSSTISATKSNEVALSLAKGTSVTADSIEISFIFNRRLKLLSGDFINLNGEKHIMLESSSASITLGSATEIKGDFFKLNITAEEIATELRASVTVIFKNNGQQVLRANTVSYFNSVCTEHKFGDWKFLVEPDCETKGSKTRSCSICKFSETADAEPLGHDFSNTQILREPTCLDKGYQRAFCPRCERKLLEEIAPKGHSMGEWTTVTAPTCEEKGSEKSVCSGCGLTETRETAALGHEFKEAVITKEPTIGKEGVQTGQCIRCNKSTDSPVPCGFTDKATGIKMDAKKGVYPTSAKTKITEIKNGTSQHSGVAEALAHITNQFIAYNIKVTNLGVEVAPDGEVTLTFPIPEKFGSHSAFYYITEENTVKKLSVTKSEDGRYATFKFMGNGRYAVCKTAYAADDEFVAAASANGTLILIVSALSMLICWAIVALKIIKAKNKKLYYKIVRSIPTKSDIRNAVKRYIFLIKENTKKPQ